MSLTRNQAIKSFSSYLDEYPKYDLLSLIIYCNMNYKNNWHNWIDWTGTGFSFKESKLAQIELSSSTSIPADIQFLAHPKNYINECESIFYMQEKNRERFWFWNRSRFFRYAEFSAGWKLKTPCQAGVISSSKVLSNLLDSSKKCDGLLVNHVTQLPSLIQELFNLD